MVKRWLLRILFLLPILLVAAGWIESYGHQDACDYITPEHDYYVDSIGGCVHVGYFTAATIFDPASLGWHHFRVPLPKTDRDPLARWNWLRDTLLPSQRQILLRRPDVFLGFGYAHWNLGDYDQRLVSIPYYFPLLLFSVLLVIVWRKTRARRVGGAFPVDMKTKRWTMNAEGETRNRKRETRNGGRGGAKRRAND